MLERVPDGYEARQGGPVAWIRTKVRVRGVQLGRSSGPSMLSTPLLCKARYPLSDCSQGVIAKRRAGALLHLPCIIDSHPVSPAPLPCLGRRCTG